jgi:hypothetical protein
MGCDTAFHDYISNCNTAIKVNALLTAAKPYSWVITDKFGKEYTGVTIADGDGFLSIPVDQLPDGLLTPYSGDFKLEIYEENDTCRKVDFKMARFYDSIVFSVSPGPREKDNIGCDFSCETADGGPGNSAIFPFTSLSSLTIPWTSFLRSLYGGTPTVQVYQQSGPDEYDLVNVNVTMVGGPYDLSEIDIDLGGPSTGYVLIS